MGTGMRMEVEMGEVLLAGFDVVFQEVPGEVSLALNLAGCPHRCPGCHSPQLQRREGEVLTDELFLDLIERYGLSVTCICFMGGDAQRDRLVHLAHLARRAGLRTAWYSGLAEFPAEMLRGGGGQGDGGKLGEQGEPGGVVFDYVKLGPYRQDLGGLDSPTTNQRFYAIRDGEWIDQTSRFFKSMEP